MYFPTDNYFGFYAAELEQIPMGYLYTYSFFVFLLFYISLFLCSEAFATDLKGIVADMNLKFSHKGHKLSKNMKISYETKLLIKEFVDLHDDMIRYSLKFYNKILLKCSKCIFSISHNATISFHYNVNSVHCYS